MAERAEVPYGDLRATDLLWTIDSLVHQQRLLPGQLPPLLSLIGVREVVTGADDDLARSDAPPPADAAAELASQPGFSRPARSYGPVKSFAPSTVGPAVRLPEVRRYDLPAARGLVRIEPRAAPIVVDGSADALAGLAAFGALGPDRALLYSGDLTASQLRDELADGGDLVISDSNRRSAFIAASLDQNTGPTLTAEQTVTADGQILDPFGRGPDFETVATYTGVRSVQAPASPQIPQFPEHAPFAAIDGNPQTAWLADPTLDPSRRWLEVDFDRPIDVPYVDLLPYDDSGGAVRQVQIAGRTFAVHPGWNHLVLGVRHAAGLRVTLTSVSPPAAGAAASAGGISELRIPGVHAGEQLRLPVDAANAVRGTALDRVTLTYLFQRTTGDDPFQRGLAHAPFSAREVHDPGDAELTMARQFELPASRSFSSTAWVTVAAQAGDDTLDRLAGYRGPVDATSSGRLDGKPRWRASQAFDGDPRTAWIAAYGLGGPAWLQWRAESELSVSTLRLAPPTELVRRPTEVRLQWPTGSTPPLAVGPGGSVVLPHRVRAREFRLVVLSARAPAGASAADRGAVGIAEVSGVGGLPTIRIPSTSRFSAPCGSAVVRIGGSTLGLSVSGTATAFEDGTPLFARSCGRPLALAAGTVDLAVAPGPFAVDELRLSSPAPQPVSSAPSASGRVLDSGTPGRGSDDHVLVDVSRPSWLVLGEGDNRGWQAWCGGRSTRHAGADRRLRERLAHRAGLPARAVLVCAEPSGRDRLHRLRARRGRVRSAAAGRRVAAPQARRGSRRPPSHRAWTVDAADPQSRWSPVRALVVALIAGAAFGFAFGLHAGAAAVVVLWLILWRGVGARPLTLLAGALLCVVVPILYLTASVDENAGNQAFYVIDHNTANWVGVAAIGLLMVALWRTLRDRYVLGRRR